MSKRTIRTAIYLTRFSWINIGNKDDWEEKRKDSNIIFTDQKKLIIELQEN